MSADVPWLDADQQAMWRAYLDGTRLLFQALDAQLQTDAGMSLMDYELLVRLSEAEGRMLRMRELADEMLATRSGVTRAVTRLESLGWVVREAVDDDRRGVSARLTDKGFATLAATAPGHVRAVRRHLVDELSPGQAAGLADVMGELRDRLLALRRGSPSSNVVSPCLAAATEPSSGVEPSSAVSAPADVK